MMTIREVITAADDVRSNSISDGTKIRWLSALDEKIYEDIILKHEDHEDFGDIHFPYTEDTQVLIAPDRWREMYETYLMAKIDYAQSEQVHYSNDAQLHNTVYREFEAWYNENHHPVENPHFKVKPAWRRREDVFANQ